ncbi:MAG: extracellular solute-binding protein, partial [Herbinix sp.]|nr:extracellular solute-binding protein [Herbinix sp.]
MYFHINRKSVLRKISVILLLIVLTSCDQQGSIKEEKDENQIVDLTGTSFETLELPEKYDIQQHAGVTLNFIVENNLYANILIHESEEFSEITGININVRAVDYDTLVQKVNLDFITQSSTYQLVYVDPYQTLNRFYNYLEVLTP